MKKTGFATYSIEVCGNNETVKFAAQELKKYLRMSLGGSRICLSGHAESQPGFIVAQARDAADVIDPAQVRDIRDIDQIFILSCGNKIILSGNNPRSVLFAVYDFLERLGFRWLHSGPGGDVVPRLKTIPVSVWHVIETASFRYRGVDVEGAYTPRHAKAFVDWMAKKKMNHFFMQFDNGAFWYRRMVPGVKVSEANKWDKEIMAEVKKRGLMLEWYGHGWNHNAIGKHVVGLDRAYKMPARFRPFIAQVNGKREWHNNYPLETQLCLTNPRVRQKVFRLFERTIKCNPHVDILGFWLADGYNNQCECDRCRKFRMSEMYAGYLNEAAELAHRLNPDLKIEALVYMTTLEYPKRVPVRNPYGNLILMLAPLCRCYRHRLYDPGCTFSRKIPKFPVLNKQPGLGLGNSNFTGYFADWRKRYKGDTYLFDYHMLCLAYDFLGGNIPEIASQDIQDLAKHSFNGYMSCQTLRCFWPSGLGMKVIAETLWNVRKPYRTILQEHLAEWFGTAASAAGKAFDKMYKATEGFIPAHGKKPAPEQMCKSCAELEHVAAGLRLAGNKQPDPVVRKRLEFLAEHAEYLANQILLSYGDEKDKKYANERLAEFFKKRVRDAEFLIDAQSHGKAFLKKKPVRKLTGEN